MSNTTLLRSPDEDGQRSAPHRSTKPVPAVARDARDEVEASDPPMIHMVVEYHPAAHSETRNLAREVASTFGASRVTETAGAQGGQRLTTTFRHACDATHAASALTRQFKALTSHASAGAAEPPRLVLYAAPRHEDVHPEHVAALSRHAGPHGALTTSATAAIAGPTLPSGVELVDIGITLTGDHRPDRLYELRVHDREGADDAPPAASNLDWARRAAGRHPSLAAGHLAVLGARWTGALGGAGTIALLTGPDGDAASAAAAELALRAHAGGAVVLHGSWDADAPRPYGAFREALGVYAAECSLARLRADLDRRAWDVARLLPELGARLGSPPAPPGPEHDEGCRVGDALSDWFRAIAARNDLLLVLDNAQWADRTSLHLCEQLGNDLADHRVLVALCGAELEMRANGLLDVALALTGGADGDGHWIALEPS